MGYLVTLEEAENFMGEKVPEIHYDIARSLASGMSPDVIAEAYGFKPSEIIELTTDESFCKMREWIAAQYHGVSLDTDEALDTLENLAAQNLVDTVRVSKDPDFNLRVLAVANKAQRRNRASRATPLDPENSGQRVQLRLSHRIVSKMNGDIVEEKTVEASKPLDLDSLKMPDPMDVGETLGVEMKGKASIKARRNAEDQMILDGLEYGVVDD